MMKIAHRLATLKHVPSLKPAFGALTCGLVLSSVLAAQAADYFPLETGNTWLFKAITILSTQPFQLDTSYQTVRVIGTERINDREYFQVSHFGRTVLLRKDGRTGNILVYDSSSGVESPWVALGLPVGSTFPSDLDPCFPQGRIGSRTAEIGVPLGSFTDGVRVDFQDRCTTGGVRTQYYAPNVGLIRYEESTPTVPLIYSLVYYRVGDRTASVPQVSFTVAVDSPVYIPGNLLNAQLTLRHGGSNQLALRFPSSQSFDLKVLDDKGQIVLTWSSDKSFLMVAREETLVPGELTYGATIPTDSLPAGKYVLQAFLTTDPILYSGEVGFEIVVPRAAAEVRQPGRGPGQP
jgi:hypothetical protein